MSVFTPSLVVTVESYFSLLTNHPPQLSQDFSYTVTKSILHTMTPITVTSQLSQIFSVTQSILHTMIPIPVIPFHQSHPGLCSLRYDPQCINELLGVWTSLSYGFGECPPEMFRGQSGTQERYLFNCLLKPSTVPPLISLTHLGVELKRRQTL